MTSPSPEPLARPRTIILTILFAGAMLSGARMIHHGLAESGTIPANGPQLFDDVRTHLANDYVDTVSDPRLYRMAVDGLMRELNDPYNAFLPPDKRKQLKKPTPSSPPTAIQHPTLLPNGIGYIPLPAFRNSTAHDLTHVVDSLIHTGAHSLIIDVRATTTDSLDQGVRISNLFLNPGQEAVHTRGRVATANHSYRDQTPQRWPTLPLAILVNRQTASAAELFAGALQDHDRAVIIGLPTHGKGVTQTLYPVDDAGALRLTTARWFTPSGRSLTKAPRPSDTENPPDSSTKNPTYKTDAGRTIVGGIGITPDVVVGDTLPSKPHTPSPPPKATDDTILLTAQRILTGIHSQAEALHQAAQLAATQKPSP